jgi:hypothetical protein
VNSAGIDGPTSVEKARMRTQEALIAVARYASVMAAIFVSVIAIGYVSLVIWDQTHQPRIPGWTAAPPAQHLAHPLAAKQHA